MMNEGKDRYTDNGQSRSSTQTSWMTEGEKGSTKYVQSIVQKPNDTRQNSVFRNFIVYALTRDTRGSVAIYH